MTTIPHIDHLVTLQLCQNSYRKWPIEIVDLRIEDCDFPLQTVSLPEGNLPSGNQTWQWKIHYLLR